MDILLMANWGIGLEILEALHRNTHVKTIIVISRHDAESEDPWKNAVFSQAQEYGYVLYDETRVNSDEIIKLIKKHRIDLLVTHAYMKLLPEQIFNAPSKGSINIHPSLLPKYRGASPTQWVLKNKELETGLTSHVIDSGMDTGPIIHQTRIQVISVDTIGTIIEKLKTTVAPLMDASIRKINDEDFIPKRQDHAQASIAPRIMNGRNNHV